MKDQCCSDVFLIVQVTTGLQHHNIYRVLRHFSLFTCCTSLTDKNYGKTRPAAINKKLCFCRIKLDRSTLQPMKMFTMKSKQSVTVCTNKLICSYTLAFLEIFPDQTITCCYQLNVSLFSLSASVYCRQSVTVFPSS